MSEENESHVEDETGRLSEEDRKKLQELGNKLMAANSQVFESNGFALNEVGFVTLVAFGPHTGHVSNMEPNQVISFVASKLEDMTGMKVLIVSRLTRLDGSEPRRMH